jgi:hypothetical protein
MSVLVESLHITPQSDPARYALVDGGSSFVAVQIAPPTESYACPACTWLRVGTRQAQPIGLLATAETIPVLLLLPDSEWPDSPVPDPASFRGPPSLA